MISVYNIIKKLKEEFNCFEVDIFLADKDEGEIFSVVLYSELYRDPIMIDLNTFSGNLENFSLKNCCDHLRFELSCIEDLDPHLLYKDYCLTTH